ncbi:MAG: SagB/ThcOx family dehydrogenase [Asgard group archaeon]|nr:SagB/ThcOx family dehydrogenase [Asgard group archaeon]
MSFDRKTILKYRKLLKAFDSSLFPDDFESDQQKKVPNPPLQKPYHKDAIIVELIAPDKLTCGTTATLFTTLQNRKSRRSYSEAPLTLEELSFLLWATQGVHEVNKHHGSATKRVVPSGGARHPFETYLIVNRVEDIEPGLYRYLAIEHKLLFIKSLKSIKDIEIKEIASQAFVASGAVVFVWAAIPYRMEWRYSIMAHKAIAQEAGHICQNLYLACEAVNAGMCSINAYNQELLDNLFELDGEDEFTVYISSVGKL